MVSIFAHSQTISLHNLDQTNDTKGGNIKSGAVRFVLLLVFDIVHGQQARSFIMSIVRDSRSHIYLGIGKH